MTETVDLYRLALESIRDQARLAAEGQLGRNLKYELQLIERHARAVLTERETPRCVCEGGEFVKPSHVTVSGAAMVTGIDHEARP